METSIRERALPVLELVTERIDRVSLSTLKILQCYIVARIFPRDCVPALRKWRAFSSSCK